VLRRPTIFGVFLIWAFLVSLAVYTWAGEKMPWLLLHPLLPLLLLAGLGVQAIWQWRAHARRVGLAAAALAGMFLIHSSFPLSYQHPADPAEILVFTQTTPDAVEVRNELLAIDRRVAAATGHHLQLDVDAWGGTSFPWAWYLRDLSVNAFPDMSSSAYQPANEALLIADPNRGRLEPVLASRYRGYRFHLRSWWLQDYGKAGPGDWARWLIWRTPWGPKGYLDEWVYVRTDLPGSTLIAN
jgi:predicted membrane-bound mannosyltransferase